MNSNVRGKSQSVSSTQRTTARVLRPPGSGAMNRSTVLLTLTGYGNATGGNATLRAASGTSPWISTVFATMGLASNLFAFVVLINAYKKAQSRSRSCFLVLLCGLVVTDFTGLGVTGSIVLTYHHRKFNWDELDPHCHLCKFLGFSMVFFGLSPLLLGATMAVERFLGINRPFLRTTSSSKQRAWLTVFMTWLFAAVVGLLPIWGLGKYTHQYPKSWCFFNMTSESRDMAFSLVFSAVGLLSLALSVLLNTISVITLIKVCFSRESQQRRRDHEVEMMVQLLGIMVIATVCWAPLLVFITKIAFTDTPKGLEKGRTLLMCIRIATWNQILDPWVYILFRRSILKKFYPSLKYRPSISSLYPAINASYRRRFTQASITPTLE